ncbi:hypothetical protein V9648_004292 [Vibrio vulnificus]
METRKNPWEIPEWHSIGKEASLIRHLIGSGATSLGKANYADKIGEYYNAFFGLSVGIERLAKLILVVNYSLLNQGRMPNEKVVRKFGHNISDLVEAVENISNEQELSLRYSKPTNSICKKIVECLDSFADARRGRYANFSSLGNPNLSSEEPIEKWWSIVAEEILKEHYYGKRVQHKVESNARVTHDIITPFSMVLHTNETGEMMQDVFTASVRTGQTDIVQRYGRYYALSVVRWLSCVYVEIAEHASYKKQIDAFYGSWEHLQTYTVSDDFLKTRKVWPLT